jgi:hypothetical protein
MGLLLDESRYLRTTRQNRDFYLQERFKNSAKKVSSSDPTDGVVTFELHHTSTCIIIIIIITMRFKVLGL